jgi:hypothetical protein
MSIPPAATAVEIIGTEALIEHTPRTGFGGKECTGSFAAAFGYYVGGSRIPLTEPLKPPVDLVQDGENIILITDLEISPDSEGLQEAKVILEKLPPSGTSITLPLKNLLLTCSGCAGYFRMPDAAQATDPQPDIHHSK